MDILLDADGDLHLSTNGDISFGNSVLQKIRICLLWFEGEWRWNTDVGIPYLTELFIKNPDTDYFESCIREKIFEVEEVTEVKNVAVIYDRKKRTAVIQYTAVTDYEIIRDEVKIKCQITE